MYVLYDRLVYVANFTWIGKKEKKRKKTKKNKKTGGKKKTNQTRGGDYSLLHVLVTVVCLFEENHIETKKVNKLNL